MKFCTRRLHFVLVFALVVLLGSALCSRGGVWVVSGQDEALSSALADADSALRQAFVAVSDAEAVGANVSALIAELDAAGQALSEAEFVNAVNDPSQALSLADQCTALANSVADEAVSLKSATVAAQRITVWQSVVFSMVSAFIFLMALTLVWLWFTRSYRARWLRAKPEVET